MVEMKGLVILCGIALGSLWLGEARPQCDYRGQKLAVGTYNITCGTLTCHPDGTTSAVGCGDQACPPGKTIGYREQDDSKVYPECCSGPICAE